MNRDRPKYQQIIQAALEVIAENGYHASQVSKIAKRANVADGTIYLYFKNKEDILISVFRERMGEFINQIEESIRDKETSIEKLKTLITMHYTQLAEAPFLARVTQLELRQSKLELRREINKVLKSYLDVIDSIIKQGIEEKEIRDDIHPRLIRQMIFGTIDETVTTWVMKSERYELVDQIDGVHELLVNGLRKQDTPGK